MPAPRVIMVIQKFHPYVGGAENQALALSRGLIDKGLSVKVLTGAGPSLSSFETIGTVPVYRLGSDSFWFALKSSYWLFKNRDEFDVIHVHLASSHAIGASLVGKLFRKKVFVKIAGSDQVGEIAVSRRSFLGRMKLRALALLKPSIIVVSRNQVEQLKGFGLDQLVWTLIPNGVDTRLFQIPSKEQKAQARKNLGWEKPTWLFMGRFSADKLRLDVFENLLEAWSRVPDLNIFHQLVFVGKGDLERPYREIIKAKNLTGSVSLLPETAFPLPYYQAADVFVLPSISEGLSNAMLEALACGLPVCGARVTGIQEIIREGVNGCLFDPLGVSEITEALNRAKDLFSFGQADRLQTRVEGTHLLSNTVDQFAKVYTTS